MSELTANELKALTITFFDTLLVGALLAHLYGHDPRLHAPDLSGWRITSYAITATLPIGAIFGRCFTGCAHDRITKMMMSALAVTAVCCLIATATILSETGASFVACCATAWGPTALAVVAYERWTRPAPMIPVCILPEA
jgi:hypothetical protein|nr:hypothetical protein [Kofleriaceae bacterium]